jgi:hypothetical protein
VIPNPHPKYRVPPEPEPKPSQLGFHPLTRVRVRVGPTGLGILAIPNANAFFQFSYFYMCDPKQRGGKLDMPWSAYNIRGAKRRTFDKILCCDICPLKPPILNFIYTHFAHFILSSLPITFSFFPYISFVISWKKISKN